MKRWTVAPWTDPRTGTEWCGVFGKNKTTPSMVFSVENEAHRWASILNEQPEAKAS